MACANGRVNPNSQTKLRLFSDFCRSLQSSRVSTALYSQRKIKPTTILQKWRIFLRQMMVVLARHRSSMKNSELLTAISSYFVQTVTQ